MTEFRVWAPAASQAEIELGGQRQQLSRAGGGWWAVSLAGAAADAQYGFRLDGGDLLADARCASQMGRTG